LTATLQPPVRRRAAQAVPVRLERRLDQPGRIHSALLPVGSLLLAMVLVGVLLGVAGHDPFAALSQVVSAAVTGQGSISATLTSATPLLFTGLAAAVAFRMRIWNIGGEGQLYIGAICAAGVGIATGASGLAVALPLMLIAAALGGALWAAIPALLRAFLNTNEILTSLMLNYVAGLLLGYLILDSTSYWRDMSGPTALVYPQGKSLASAAFWPGFTGGGLIIPLGLVFGVALAVLVFVMIRHTWFGYQLRVTADNAQAGRYAGMASRRNLVAVMMLSGALAALGGASQVGDFSHLLDPSGLQQPQYGYTGIVVAALARYNPLAVVLSALFLGAITNAGLNLQSATFPQSLTGVIEGIILFCVLGGEVLSRYRFVWGRR
jgi:simple sugar transport system permease protein